MSKYGYFQINYTYVRPRVISWQKKKSVRRVNLLILSGYIFTIEIRLYNDNRNNNNNNNIKIIYHLVYLQSIINKRTKYYGKPDFDCVTPLLRLGLLCVLKLFLRYSNSNSDSIIAQLLLVLVNKVTRYIDNVILNLPRH